MADWMGRLPAEVRAKPISQLCIPGSHDSGSDWFNLQMDYAHDQDFMKYIRRFHCGFVKRIVKRWAITQTMGVDEQLLNGVRFFDIRLEYAMDHTGSSPQIDADDDDIRKRCFIVHGLYGADWLEVIDKISLFLEAHPTEVVILNVNHTYRMSDFDYRRFVLHPLTNYATRAGTNLAQTWVDLRYASLDLFLRKNFRIILVGPQDYDVDNCSFRSSAVQNPWPMKDKIADLLKFMQIQIHTPVTPGIRVMQGVLTPKLSTIVTNFRKSLKSVFSLPCRVAVKNWIRDMDEEEVNNLNVIMIDQVDAEFCRLVYDLNVRDIPSGMLEKPVFTFARDLCPSPPETVILRAHSQFSSISEEDPEIYIEEITEDIERPTSTGPPKPPRMVMMDVVEMVLPSELDEPVSSPSPIPPPKPKRFSMRVPIVMQVEEIIEEDKPVSPPPFPIYRVSGTPVRIAPPVTPEEIRLARLGKLPSYGSQRRQKLTEKINEGVEMVELKKTEMKEETAVEDHSSDESSALLPQNINNMVEDLVIHSTLDAMDNLADRFKSLISPSSKETWI